MKASSEKEIDYQPALDRDWKLVIGGQSAHAENGATYENVSPVTEQVICRVPDASDVDVRRAVEAGKKASAEWRRVSTRERGRLVRALGDVLRKHREELALLDAIDAGNAYTYMLADVDFAADAIEFMGDIAFSLTGQTLPATSNHLHYTRYEPFGVVARIVAFNHPIMFAAQKIAAPLVAGNAVILKPSDLSPLSALRMGELLAPHLPEGLLSVLTGLGTKMPRALVRHPDVKRIGFIGSETAGRSIQRDAAEVAVKHVTLELGGKNAIIVCDDSPPAAAAAGVVKGMNFGGWQSQSCSSTSRLLVHESVADEVTALLVEQIEELRIGSPLRPDTQMGPLCGSRQFERVMSYIDLAQAEGAMPITGGTRPSGPDCARGFYVLPTVMDQVQPSMRIANEEVFGPVLSIMRWSTEQEAIDIANSASFGLTGAIWTRDVARAHRLAHEMDAGFIWINNAAEHFTGIPFGGYKASGIGKEECVEELISYSQEKAINLHLGN